MDLEYLPNYSKVLTYCGIFWLPEDKTFIDVIKRNPVIYQGTKDGGMKKHILKAVWEKVATQTNMTSQTCQNQWSEIELRYAKIKNLIRSGKVSKHTARQHPKSLKFMDGTLKFLDPYVRTITDSKIPMHIHHYFKELIEREASNGSEITHDIVLKLLETKRYAEDDLDDHDMGYLKNVIKTAVIQKLNDIQDSKANSQATGINHSVINKSGDSNNGDERYSFKDHKLEVESNFTNKMEMEVAHNVKETFDTEKHILPDITIKDKIIIIEDDSDAERDFTVDRPEDRKEKDKTIVRKKIDYDPKAFFLKYDVARHRVIDMRQYLKDLAEFLCCHIALDKRKYLLEQIDLLVSGILDS